MKNLSLFFFLLILCSCFQSSAQQNNYVEDARVIKFEKEIFDFVHGMTKTIGADGKMIPDTATFTSKNFDWNISVVRFLDIYTDTVYRPLLLVRIGPSGDDVPKAWGVLTDNSHYFFYDPNNLNEADVAAFRLRYPKETLDIIDNLCYKYSTSFSAVTFTKDATYWEYMYIVKGSMLREGDFNRAKADSARHFF